MLTTKAPQISAALLLLTILQNCMEATEDTTCDKYLYKKV